METIFAVSTPPGRGGVVVIRVSGPDVGAVVDRFELGYLPNRKAVVRNLTDGDQVLDQALILRFPMGASFTGEDVLELHLHGSPAIRNAVLAVLEKTEGCRHAEPGEFSRRALENGKMDIAQVEGLAALIDAETEVQRQMAQRIFAGSLGNLAERWRAKLLQALALLEVTIDFADEEVPVDVRPDVILLIEEVLADLRKEAAGVSVAERLREGFEVAIVGAPNAGKSTLLNALAGRDAAITSEYAGTTRDVIEVRMDLNGLPVTFLDTAGLRDTTDEIEALGIGLAVRRAEDADLRIFLKSDELIPNVVVQGPDDIIIWGKGDLIARDVDKVSGTTGHGVQTLLDRIVSALDQRVATIQIATHARHRNAMLVALKDFEVALEELSLGEDRTELAAESLHRGIRAIDELVGRVDVESILGEIFSRFCLGK